jgi:alpha-L-fucosidase 2
MDQSAPLGQNRQLLLWYDRPAREAMTEGLPLGNGQLGALVLGGVDCDRWVLNEGTLFSGGPYQPINPEALAALPEVRRLIFDGQYQAATALAEDKLVGRPKRQASYQPLGDLWLEFARHTSPLNYRRELDLDRAVHAVRYSVNGVDHCREMFVSAADQVLVARFTASRPALIDCVIRITSEQRGLYEPLHRGKAWYNSRGFGLRGRNHADCGVAGRLRFAFGAEIRAQGGRVMPGEGQLSVRDANELLIVCAAATNYRRYNDLSIDPDKVVAARLEAVRELSFEDLLDRHLGDYQPRFRRMTLEFGAGGDESATDARIAAFASGADPALAALYVQYARYLLLACSREGSQPANLQGLWNDDVDPPWGCKCTININTEMNYWLALPAALPECDEPVLRLLEDLSLSGRTTAQAHYGARGWVVHHNVDLWRASAPVDGAEWGQWPLGGAWLCLQLWDHYQFTLEVDYLRRIYPVLKGAAEFFCDSLVEDPRSKCLVTCPSVSPENRHPFGTTVCAGPAIDGAILRDLFAATAQAARLLQLDAPLQTTLGDLGRRLPAYRVGKGGQLQEWQEDWDLEAPEPHHRHVSHLFGLHPSRQISPRTTPDLAAAARKSLELRGDAATGWSLAWKVNFWARLLDGERALQLLAMLLSPDRTYTNLFDAHPPFQIDGNFGGAVGILEMLLQSEPGRLHLLPALPQAWHEGKLCGIRARGALIIDLEWSHNALIAASITSAVDQALVVTVANAKPLSIELRAGQTQRIEGGPPAS